MNHLSAIPTPVATSIVDDVPGPARSKPIGELLVEAGRMTPAQVQQVLDAQRERGGRFGEIALRLKLVDRASVEEVLAQQFGYKTATELSRSLLPAKIVTAFDPMSPFLESVRTLRSQLMLRWFDGTPQQSALAVTSVDRGDGKSFVTASLAVAFSQLGERTVLIDADLRHPTQHEVFGLQNRLGLSGVLSGRADLSEITPLPGLPNLSVLPSGPLPPNPQELLGRAAFRRLLDELSSMYDVVLVDTPSAQEASDAHVIAQRTGATLLVGRKNRTRSQELAQLAAIFTNSGIQVLGSTLNEY